MDTIRVATKVDIQRLELKFEKLDVKLDKLQDTLDGFVGTVDDLRTDNIVGTHHAQELQIKADDHDLPAGRQEKD